MKIVALFVVLLTPSISFAIDCKLLIGDWEGKRDYPEVGVTEYWFATYYPYGKIRLTFKTVHKGKEKISVEEGSWRCDGDILISERESVYKYKIHKLTKDYVKYESLQKYSLGNLFESTKVSPNTYEPSCCQ